MNKNKKCNHRLYGMTVREKSTIQRYERASLLRHTYIPYLVNLIFFIL